jgi:hypothetical protein
MVRKGSPVRVRQRALEKALLRRVFFVRGRGNPGVGDGGGTPGEHGYRPGMALARWRVRSPPTPRPGHTWRTAGDATGARFFSRIRLRIKYRSDNPSNIARAGRRTGLGSTPSRRHLRIRQGELGSSAATSSCGSRISAHQSGSTHNRGAGPSQRSPRMRTHDVPGTAAKRRVGCSLHLRQARGVGRLLAAVEQALGARQRPPSPRMGCSTRSTTPFSRGS